MICPNCGTRLPEGSTRCHFCGFEIHSRPTRAETGIVVVSLAAVMIAVSLFFVVLTANAGGDLRIRVVFCFAIGAVAAWCYWKLSRWVNPRLARIG
jgi:uncharacterized protein (DUF983 family)